MNSEENTGNLKGKNLPGKHRVALIDMDGVLYDSMKYHTSAWKRLADDYGVPASRDEFFLYEGMTGAATIRHIWQRIQSAPLPDHKVRQLYELKTRYFHEFGAREPMPGAERMLKAFKDARWDRVLVTGSGQQSLLKELDTDFPGAFEPGKRVTAADVSRGKPDPEPYLKGMELAGASPEECIVVENAPLGVRAAKAAGCFTIAVTTGPIPVKEFEKENADLIFPSMEAFADILPGLLENKKL